MKNNRYTLRVLSQLLSYPDAALRAQLPQLMPVLQEEGALSAGRQAELQTLAAHLQRLDSMDAESRYVETFDRGRATCLHLFEHVHGDSRDRGPAMIDLTKTYEQSGLFLSPDELPDLAQQRVQTRINGQLVQDQPVSDMIWDVAFVIEYCSTFAPLSPGDVIVTGTPGGVGDKRNPPLYMKGGDVCEVSIGVIGTLSNPVIDEA